MRRCSWTAVSGVCRAMDACCRIDLLGGLLATVSDRQPAGTRMITRFRTQKTGGLLAYREGSENEQHK